MAECRGGLLSRTAAPSCDGNENLLLPLSESGNVIGVIQRPNRSTKVSRIRRPLNKWPAADILRSLQLVVRFNLAGVLVRFSARIASDYEKWHVTPHR